MKFCKTSIVSIEILKCYFASQEWNIYYKRKSRKGINSTVYRSNWTLASILIWILGTENTLCPVWEQNALHLMALQIKQKDGGDGWVKKPVHHESMRTPYDHQNSHIKAASWAWACILRAMEVNSSRTSGFSLVSSCQ